MSEVPNQVVASEVEQTSSVTLPAEGEASVTPAVVQEVRVDALEELGRRVSVLEQAVRQVAGVNLADLESAQAQLRASASILEG